MPVALLVAGAAFFLEHQDVVVLEVLQNLAFNRGAFYNRCTYFDLTVVVCEQDLVETYGRILFALETVNIKFPTFLSLKLLTCNLYYYVHFIRRRHLNLHLGCKYNDKSRIYKACRKFFGRPPLWHGFGPVVRAGIVGPADRIMHHRILIVAEDAFVRDVIRLSLVGLEAEVRCVEDGERMRRLCRRMQFDLIIVLQATMFLCGGNPVREVRPAGLRRPVVYVLSWQQAEQTVLSLLEAGVDQYMTFPVSLQRLRRKVADELGRSC